MSFLERIRMCSFKLRPKSQTVNTPHPPHRLVFIYNNGDDVHAVETLAQKLLEDSNRSKPAQLLYLMASSSIYHQANKLNELVRTGANQPSILLSVNPPKHPLSVTPKEHQQSRVSRVLGRTRRGFLRRILQVAWSIRVSIGTW